MWFYVLKLIITLAIRNYSDSITNIGKFVLSTSLEAGIDLLGTQPYHNNINLIIMAKMAVV